MKWILLAACLLLVLLGLFLLWPRDQHAALAGARIQATATEADAASPVPGSIAGPAVGAVSRVEPYVDIASEAAAARSPASASAVTVFGIVHPAAGRTAFERAPSVGCISQLGERTVAKAAEDGGFSISGLSAGRYYLGVHSLEDGRARAQVVIAPGELEKRVDLHLVLPRVVWIRVVDPTGKPAPPFVQLAVATRDAPGDWLDEVYGSFNNPFGIGQFHGNGEGGPKRSEEWLGRVTVEEEPPFHVSLVHYQRVIATRRVEAGETEITFVIDPESASIREGSLRFRVTDAASGQPIAGAYAWLSGFGMRTVQCEGETFVAPRLSPGLYELAVRAKERETVLRRVRIEPGVETDLHDLPLSAGVEISGRILDTQGEGVATRFSYEPLDEEGRRLPPVGGVNAVQAEADGSFHLPRFSAGRYLLVSLRDESGHGIWSRAVDTRAGPVTGLEIRLAKGVPLVVSGSDERWSSVRFEILDASGAWVTRRKLHSPEPTRILLAPGSYTIDVLASQSNDARQIAVTLSSEPVAISLP